MIELPRDALLESLERAAAAGHLLVVGEPGAGKSWILQSFVQRRKNADDGVVFLRAEDYVARSLDELLKDIGTKDFVAALRRFRGVRKYLVIDSLDALRAEASQRAFRDLIRIVQREVPDFKILASMRTFDAKQSAEFHELFPVGDQPPLPNTLLIPARHFAIPVFSEAELTDAIRRDPRLSPVVRSASPAGRALLRNPFNLWLIIHLLDAGATVDWFSTIQSEVQLLEQYWQHRIESRENSFIRKRLLSSLTQTMVSTNTLSVALRDLPIDESHEGVYKRLLSDDILFKTETDRVSYTHNIFFDFAVSRLLLDETTVIPFVVEAPARSIFYRPSISYFMARLWFRDRKLFWQSIEAFFDPSPSMSSIAAITPAMVIYEVAAEMDDLAPIFELSPSKRPRAVAFLLRAIQAFDGFHSNKRDLWAKFLISAFEYMHLLFLNEFIALLELAVENPDVSRANRISLCDTATGLLHWIWKTAESAESSAGQELTNVASARLIPIVAKQYRVIPKAAKNILEEVLRRFNNPKASANEAFRLASNIDAVIDADPEFASEVYIHVLGSEETSDETTQMGSAILPLTSTRAQDFSLSYYVLGVKYALLVARDLRIATRAAVLSITAEVKLKEGDAIAKLGAYERKFKFHGKVVTLISDRSDIWDHSAKDYTSLQLLQWLLRHLEESRKNDKLSLAEVRDIVVLIAELNTFAVTWKRLLNFAAHSPELLASIPDLLQIPELLAAPETTVEAGRAIGRAYEDSIYTTQRFAAIEAAILSIPNSEIASIYKDPAIVRNRLLGCIPEPLLSADSAKIIEELRKTTGVPENTPSFQMGPVSYGPDVDDGWLKRQGVQTEREDNQSLLSASRSLKVFESQFVNQTPPESECTKIAAPLWNAYELVQSTKSADEKVVTDVLTSIAAVAQSILKNGNLAKESDVVSKCKVIIADAAIYPLPAVSERADANFDRPMWGPTPKIEAVQGVMHYIANWGLDPDMQLLAESLSGDSSPAVRFQIASGIIYIYERYRDFFWNIVNKRLPEENATGVLVALARNVAHPYIASKERSAVLDWETALLARTLPDQRPEDVLEVVVDSLTQLFVFFAEDRAGQLLARFESDPAAHARELSQMALSACSYLPRGIGSANPEDESIRVRARSILDRVLTAADALAIAGFNEPSKTKGRNLVQEALKITDNVVFQLYLALGVNEKLAREDLKPPTEANRRLLFFELEPIWKRLTTPIVPTLRRFLAAQTTHHLMELFSRTLQYDPPHVLQFAANLLRGYNLGYQFDSMAIDEIVRFADVVLADYKPILKDPANASNLGAILDVFVEAGWPQATQLVMKLDSAVR